MNLYSPFTETSQPLPPPMQPRQQRAADYFSLSQTLRRIAHDYRRWALEDEKSGNLERYRKYRKSSDDAWQNSLWYLSRARLERDY